MTWYRSNEDVDRVLIKLLLRRQGIESNPGPDPDPGPVPQRANVSVRTNNCNGLGVTDKFRRILIKIRKEVRHGGIVLLQETHIKRSIQDRTSI